MSNPATPMSSASHPNKEDVKYQITERGRHVYRETDRVTGSVLDTEEKILEYLFVLAPRSFQPSFKLMRDELTAIVSGFSGADHEESVKKTYQSILDYQQDLLDGLISKGWIEIATAATVDKPLLSAVTVQRRKRDDDVDASVAPTDPKKIKSNEKVQVSEQGKGKSSRWEVANIRVKAAESKKQTEKQTHELQERENLIVPFSDKDQVKELGAKWDPAARTWYIPQNFTGDRTPFAKWQATYSASSANTKHASARAFFRSHSSTKPQARTR